MRSFIAAAAVVLMLPALALAQKTSFDFDKNADFTQMKTFALRDGTKVNDPFIHDRIVAAIETQLREKGFVRNEADPDMVAVYHIAFDKQQDITTYSSGYAGGYGPYGYGWGGGFGTTDTMVREILIGTLVIDIADAKKKQIVFRGTGVREVDVQAKAEKRDKNVNNAVKKILKNFPPKPKK